MKIESGVYIIWIRMYKHEFEYERIDDISLPGLPYPAAFSYFPYPSYPLISE